MLIAGKRGTCNFGMVAFVLPIRIFTTKLFIRKLNMIKRCKVN